MPSQNIPILKSNSHDKLSRDLSSSYSAERRFTMSSPPSQGIPIASVSGTPQSPCSSPLSSSPNFYIPSSPELQTQKSILEHLFERKLVEGDFWYIVVAEWIEHLKKYLGIQSTRKFYTQRVATPPGPLVTRRDYSHTVDVVHEDTWRMLVQWYGLSESHKIMKLVVYKYKQGPAIEHNINQFKIIICNAPPENFHIARFSKLEKVGYIEYKARELYEISKTTETRLWAKPDVDSDWCCLLYRNKAIGIVLNMDSDFTRPIVALETSVNGAWIGPPETAILPEDGSTKGHILENSLFDDVTGSWEIDIHKQIDVIGKNVSQQLHGNFNVFVQKAKDHIEARESQIRERERHVCSRESVTERLASSLELKERRLQDEMTKCQDKIKEYENRRLEIERQLTERREELETEMLEKWREADELKEELLKSKEHFEDELQRMSELNKSQDSRIKLDIGGTKFTTSILTLTKEPDSMLAAMFSGRHKLKTEEDGSVFIDRDGTHFRFILNYLRDGFVKEGTLPHGDGILHELTAEAEYYQLAGLLEYLETSKKHKPI